MVKVEVMGMEVILLAIAIFIMEKIWVVMVALVEAWVVVDMVASEILMMDFEMDKAVFLVLKATVILAITTIRVHILDTLKSEFWVLIEMESSIFAKVWNKVSYGGSSNNYSYSSGRKQNLAGEGSKRNAREASFYKQFETKPDTVVARPKCHKEDMFLDSTIVYRQKQPL